MFGNVNILASQTMVCRVSKSATVAYKGGDGITDGNLLKR